MIVEGIPRMLPACLYRNDEFAEAYQQEIESARSGRGALAVQGGDLVRHKRNTIESFGWEWHAFDRFGYDHQTFNIEKEEERFYINTFLEPADLRGKLVIDGGCGNGRYSNQCLRQGAEVVGIDLSPAVEVARNNLRRNPSAHFVQGDLFKLPFRPHTFDVAFSIGVLMHTGDTRRAFVSLSGVLKDQGLLGVSVYKKQNPLHEFNDRWLRALTIRMPNPLLYNVTRVMARFADMAGKVRLLGVINAFLRLEPYHLCVYDWYKAPIATHHTENEMREWFAEIGAGDIRDDSHLDDRDLVRKWIWPRCGFTMRGKMQNRFSRPAPLARPSANQTLCSEQSLAG